ncbi:MAG: hypothetical protein ACOC8X_13405, partial [Chloroflexota bacterium]
AVRLIAAKFARLANVTDAMRYTVFQMADVTVPRDLMRRILENMADLLRPLANAPKRVGHHKMTTAHFRF